jgi:hypothetical protein
MPTLLEFYNGSAKVKFGQEELTLLEVLNKDDDWWEGCHNFIQWVFPTKTLSKFNHEALLLTINDIKDISHDRYCMCLKRFFTFISRTRGLEDEFNHNFLRVSRVIEMTALIYGRRYAADVLLTAVKYTNIDSNPFFKNRESLNFWMKAMESSWD